MTEIRPEHLDEMKRYVRFGAEDVDALHALRDKARPSFEPIVREFYERAREHDAAHSVFESEAQIERLHVSLMAWLERVLTGPYDDAYAEKSARIGLVHVRVGLPQRYMFTAMALFRMRLSAIARDELGDRAWTAIDALTRILDLELALMTHAYRAATQARTSRLELEARERLTNTLAQTERRYVRAVDIVGTMMVGLDLEGRIQLFNREAERITGYVHSDVLGRSFEEVIIGAGEREFGVAWQAVTSASEAIVVPARCVVRTRAGKRREIAGWISRDPRDEDGELIILAGRDVTDELALEQRARRNEKLAAVGTMAAGLAHEIRNPLNGAQLHLTFLSRSLQRVDEPKELLDAIDVVSGEIARLSSLVNDFLDFARPVKLNRSRVNVQELCDRAATIALGDAVGLDVEVALPDSPVEAEIDPDRMHQVLLNLLANAGDAAAQGVRGRVTLKLYREPRQAVIEVHDDGPGIPPDSPIFDAFFSTKSTGTGLGLAITHRIVDDHGGRVEVESKPGHTMFRVCLPLSDPDRPPSSRAPTLE